MASAEPMQMLRAETNLACLLLALSKRCPAVVQSRYPESLRHGQDIAGLLVVRVRRVIDQDPTFGYRWISARLRLEQGLVVNRKTA